MNITLAGTKVSMDGHTLAFQKNNLVDSMVITVDTDETWQYKLDVKYPCKDSKGEQLYNVIDLTRVGNTCTAILQASMLPFNGKYTMQLRGISDDKVYHTDTFDVWVKYSIDPSKVYDPVPSEFYQIEQAVTEEAANAKQAATESAESARQAAVSSTSAQQSAENAANSANEAQKSREAIENMEVAAVSLPPDTDATVEKSIVDDKVKLTFGIPKGENGEEPMVVTFTIKDPSTFALKADTSYADIMEAVNAGKIVYAFIPEPVGPFFGQLVDARDHLVFSAQTNTGASMIIKMYSDSDIVGKGINLLFCMDETFGGGDFDAGYRGIKHVKEPTGDSDAATKGYVDKSLGSFDLSLGLTAATVGQTVKVKAVDTDGKPTEWEAVDAAGAETWEKIAEIELRADTAEYVLADFATWRKAKVIMTRPKYISGLNKNVWCKVVWDTTKNEYSCGYMTIEYGYVFWAFTAEVNELCITSEALQNNNIQSSTYVKSTGTLTPLKAPIENHKFELIFTDTSVIQDGDKVTVIGVRR